MRSGDTHVVGTSSGSSRRARLLPVAIAAAALIGAAGLGREVWQLRAVIAGQTEREADALQLRAELALAKERAERLEATVFELDQAGDKQRAMIQKLASLNGDVLGELNATRQALGEAQRRRDEAAALVGVLARATPASAPAGPVRPVTPDELNAMQASLHRALEERDQALATGESALSQVALSDARAADAASELDATKQRFQSWVQEHYQALRQVVAHSGVRVDPLVQRASRKPRRGEGGPFVPVPPRGAERPGAATTLVPIPASLRTDLQALDALSSVLLAMPLGNPAPGAARNSAFGVRVDPVTRRRALHTGLDFAPTADGKARAGGPGTVLSARREKDYGNMVVVDHGFGMTTRYAHLAKLLVKPGQRVTSGDALGIIGSTGRSTGRHLHYEVRVDGKAVDPADFLEARTRLANVLSQE